MSGTWVWKSILAIGFLLLAHLIMNVTARAQAPLRSELSNGNFEAETAEGQTPSGWFFVSMCEARVALDSANAVEGNQSALIDATKPKAGAPQLFSNLMQTIDAKPWRGKKIRFRAAVKTAELVNQAAAQLWLRVDRKAGADGQPIIGAFDNMQNRPIRSETWGHHEIVLQVDDDAEQIVCGMFVNGAGKAWMDEVMLAATDASAKSTGSVVGQGFQMPPILAKAFGQADKAPQQPFFTHWLWLALIAMVLFVIGTTTRPSDLEPKPPEMRTRSQLHKFAFRFTVAYWLIYCVPHPFADLIPHAFGSLNFEPNRLGYPMSGFVSLLGQTFLEWRQWLDGLIASTTAKSVFGIKDELVPPNGSGDTTYNYILLLAGFVLALLIAVIWSLIDSRRRTDYAITRDLLRSYLRYYLAFWMLTYGLAKVSLDANQFPYIGQFQLDRTWGETSPMGVLWRFMGSSRPYTIFAGLGEVLAAVLLIWRRTGTLGALVAMGVSLNIVLLNFCYDVPVKIFSSHLLVAAMLIAIPDLNRLANLLVFNRPTTGDRSPSLWQFGLMNRIRIAAKSFVILLGFALPLAAQAWNVGSHFVKPTLTEQRDPKANSSKSLLERRGFRWINEVPFNR